MLGKCAQNTTLLAVYLHYRIASYPFLHPAPTHRFSSSLCPRATTSFVPLRTKSQTSRCIGLLPSPMYSRSQTMFPEREKCEFLSCVQHFTTLWIIARQAPLPMEFSRQEDWSRLPFPSPGDLPDPGIELSLLHCRRILYCLSHQGSPKQWSKSPWPTELLESTELLLRNIHTWSSPQRFRGFPESRKDPSLEG